MLRIILSKTKKYLIRKEYDKNLERKLFASEEK